MTRIIIDIADNDIENIINYCKKNKLEYCAFDKKPRIYNDERLEQLLEKLKVLSRDYRDLQEIIARKAHTDFFDKQIYPGGVYYGLNEIPFQGFEIILSRESLDKFLYVFNSLNNMESFINELQLLRKFKYLF